MPKKPPARSTRKPPPARRVAKAPTVATSHVNRVTLNVIRNAACCPAKLRPVLERLALEYDWKVDRMSKTDREIVYALVDGDLAERAKGEFDAKMDSIIDHRHEYTTCKLCGHHPIRFEFDLVNHAGGTTIRTGSVCISTYGLSVDGEATAERSLVMIQRAITDAQRAAEREDWQEIHFEHAEDFDYLRGVYASMKRYRYAGRLVHYLRPNWAARVKVYLRRLKGAIAYYDRHQFLTEHRTHHVYGNPDGTAAEQVGVIDSPLVPELNAAIKARKATVLAWEAWQRQVANHCNPYEAGVIATAVAYGNPFVALSSYDRDVVTEIANRSGIAHP